VRASCPLLLSFPDNLHLLSLATYTHDLEVDRDLASEILARKLYISVWSLTLSLPSFLHVIMFRFQTFQLIFFSLPTTSTPGPFHLRVSYPSQPADPNFGAWYVRCGGLIAPVDQAGVFTLNTSTNPACEDSRLDPDPITNAPISLSASTSTSIRYAPIASPFFPEAPQLRRRKPQPTGPFTLSCNCNPVGGFLSGTTGHPNETQLIGLYEHDGAILTDFQFDANETLHWYNKAFYGGEARFIMRSYKVGPTFWAYWGEDEPEPHKDMYGTWSWEDVRLSWEAIDE
jgi:hypothetical protein